MKITLKGENILNMPNVISFYRLTILSIFLFLWQDIRSHTLFA
jgi:hypothetical protein